MFYEMIKKHYDNLAVYYNWLPLLKGREFAMLTSKAEPRGFMSVRNLRATNAQSITWYIRRFDMFRDEIRYNFYYSVAKFRRGMPMISTATKGFKRIERREKLDQWNKIAIREISEYPFFVDIDAGHHEDIMSAHESARLIEEWFREKKKTYSLTFSGMGFHIMCTDLVSLESFKDEQGILDIDSLCDHYRNQAKEFYNDYSEMVDTSIYDPRRLVKLPYSLAIYPENTYVSYPFSSIKEFLKFDIRDFELANFNKQIRGRGIPIFKNGRTEGRLARTTRATEDDRKPYSF